MKLQQSCTSNLFSPVTNLPPGPYKSKRYLPIFGQLPKHVLPALKGAHGLHVGAGVRYSPSDQMAFPQDYITQHSPRTLLETEIFKRQRCKCYSCRNHTLYNKNEMHSINVLHHFKKSERPKPQQFLSQNG